MARDILSSIYRFPGPYTGFPDQGTGLRDEKKISEV